MSSASIPPPRSSPTSSSRNNYFWPILIFLLGALTLAFYQVESLEDQLDQETKALDGLDAKVRHAQYEKAKFFALARDLVRLAPAHPAAQQIVDETGIPHLQEKFPALMSLDNPVGFTNAAPDAPAAAGQTNAGAASPAPDAK